MQHVHFLDLTDRAVRGTVQRGSIYYYCHPQLLEWPDWEEETQPPAQAYPLLAATSLVSRPRWVMLQNSDPLRDPYKHHEELEPFWETPMQMWASLHKGWRGEHDYLRWHHASDSGVIPEYTNGNYILDRAQLLREGIIVDLTMVAR